MCILNGMMQWTSSYRDPSPTPSSNGPHWPKPPSPTPRAGSNFFKLDLTVQGLPTPSPEMFQLAYFKASMVGKRAVGILLKCFLVAATNRTRRDQEQKPDDATPR